MSDFHSYYLDFLGASEEKLELGQRVFPCQLRSEPETELSFNVHDLIVSVYQDKLIHSINPKLEKDYRSVAPVESSEELIATVDDAFFRISPYGHYWISEWYRYSIDLGFDDDPDVAVLNESHRALVFESKKGRRGKLYRDWIWERAFSPLLSDGSFFAILVDGKIVSRSSASDIPCGGSNIDVWTHEDYRRKGYGSRCVRQVVNWCINNGRVPVYLVSTSNTASIELAEELGFKRLTHEIRTSARVP